MGRQLYRVPLDFDAPLDEVWKGYVRPPVERCGWCRGSGRSSAGRLWEEFRRLFLMAAEDSRLKLQKTPLEPYPEGSRDHIVLHSHALSMGPRWPWPHLDPVETILKAAGFDSTWATDVEKNIIRCLAMVDVPETFYRPEYLPRGRACIHPRLAANGINWVGDRFYKLAEALGAEPGLLGYTGECYDMHLAVSRQAGEEIVEEPLSWRDEPWLATTWDLCPVCKGEPETETDPDWEKEEPPLGDGFQLWTTTSEGSPISPVFETLEELCAWCETNATTFADFRASKERWFEMLNDGLVSHKETSEDGSVEMMFF